MKFKNIAILLLAAAMLVLASCAPEIETITRKEGDYKYSLSETAEIVNIADNETIGNVTVNSCELVSDQPFVIDYYRTITETDNQGNETTKEVIVTVKFSALYKVSYSVYDSLENIDNASDHFKVVTPNFVMNPYGKKMENGYFYVGVTNDNNGESFVTLEFRYDTLQSRHTALFKLKLEKSAPSYSGKAFNGLKHTRVEYYDVY